MTDWIILGLVTGVFLTVMGALAYESVRLFFVDPSVDQMCSDTDEDLDRRYGGWRN